MLTSDAGYFVPNIYFYCELWLYYRFFGKYLFHSANSTCQKLQNEIYYMSLYLNFSLEYSQKCLKAWYEIACIRCYYDNQPVFFFQHVWLHSNCHLLVMLMKKQISLRQHRMLMIMKLCLEILLLRMVLELTGFRFVSSKLPVPKIIFQIFHLLMIIIQ